MESRYLYLYRRNVKFVQYRRSLLLSKWVLPFEMVERCFIEILERGNVSDWQAAVKIRLIEQMLFCIKRYLIKL